MQNWQRSRVRLLTKQTISIKFVGTVRPCNKLPTVLKQKINILFPYIIFILAIDKYAICGRYDIGPSGTPVPTSEI